MHSFTIFIFYKTERGFDTFKKQKTKNGMQKFIPNYNC